MRQLTNKRAINGVDTDGNIWSLLIFTTPQLDRGLWLFDENAIVLTEEMYTEFTSLSQEKQRLFMDKLLKISNTSIEW